MLLTVKWDGKAVVITEQKLKKLSTYAVSSLQQGLNDGGDKTRTVVRRTLKQQMNTKTKATIDAVTPSIRAGTASLVYIIKGIGKGLDIDKFPTRYSRSQKVMVRWDARQHWRLQKRGADGRFGAIKDVKGTGVTSQTWGKAHAFKRSFVHPEKGAVAALPDSKSLRKLYGPSPAKELVKDQTAASFEASVPSIVEPLIRKRLERMLS